MASTARACNHQVEANTAASQDVHAYPKSQACQDKRCSSVSIHLF